MAKTIRYACIGGGAIAQRRHLPEAHANPRSTVVAIADPVEARVKQLAEAYGATGYTDYHQMLKEADCDAVVVAGPNKLHAPMSIDALKAGRHVLCEKPMATSLADAREMIDTAKKAGKYLMIGQNQRLMPPHIKAKELLSGKKLGKPLTFYTSFQHPGPDGWSVDGAKSWFFDKDAAMMGAMGDLGVHKADLVRWLLGQDFVEVSGIVTTLDKQAGGKLIPLDDNAMLNCRLSGGACGVIKVAWTNYGAETNETIIWCSNGVVKLGTDPDFGVIVEYKDGTAEYHKVGEMASNVKQVASGVIDSFTDCLLKNRKPAIDGEEGYAALALVLTAMEAGKAGKTLPVK